MKTIEIVGTFTYDDEIMHNGEIDAEAKEWFLSLLKTDVLGVVSDDIGDRIGELRISDYRNVPDTPTDTPHPAPQSPTSGHTQSSGTAHNRIIVSGNDASEGCP